MQEGASQPAPALRSHQASPPSVEQTAEGLAITRLTGPRWAKSALGRSLGALSSLRWTSASIALTLGLGFATVINQPRPRAVGLARLLVAADLLQSFPVDRSQPVPDLWKQRLGSQADALWQQASGSWSQLWSGHDAGGAALVLDATTLPIGRRPAGAISVDDLVVIAPDLLAADDLKRPLRQSHRALQGLEQRCVERLQQGQAVYWSGQGMAGVLGPLTPLMMQWQQGCVSLQLSNDRLTWTGEASAVAGLAADRPAPLPVPVEVGSERAFPSGSLLLLRGPRLELLLGSLLARSLVRDALQEHYGLDQDTLQQLSGSAFGLQLRSLAAGPFRLGLTVTVTLGQQRPAWLRAMQQLDATIRRQGLQAMGAAPAATPGAVQPSQPQDQTWRRADGVIVGGWRWLGSGATTGRQRSQPTRLLLFLGPPPPPAALASTGWETQASGRLEVLMRPRALAGAGVMPASLPPLVTAAESLVMIAGHQANGSRVGTVSPLWGELRLQR